MTGKTLENSVYDSHSINSCRKLRVNVNLRRSVGFAMWDRKTAPNQANDLAVNGKPKRAGMTRQRHPALTIARKVVRHG